VRRHRQVPALEERREQEGAGFVSHIALWDSLSMDYDHFVNWEDRLAREMPFLDGFLSQRGARRVLDVACGTGQHAIALAERGYEVLGVDLSEGMIAKARANARAGASAASFKPAGFGELRDVVAEPYDAALCLGNSLPSLVSEADLRSALTDVGEVLVSHGTLILQNLNYDRVWPSRQRFMPLESYSDGNEEWLFLRFVDFHRETLTFNMVVLHGRDRTWNYRAEATDLRPIFRDDLARLLEDVGFASIQFFGDYDRNPYDEQESSDLIVVAGKG
jgi:glycine/sarcosine N-methyltransferase